MSMAFGAQVTTKGGPDGLNSGGRVHLVVSSSSTSSATNRLLSYGADMSKVIFHIYNTDSIWIRDYGARFIYEGGARALIDHRYNVLSRVKDNAQPADFADDRGLKR